MKESQKTKRHKRKNHVAKPGARGEDEGRGETPNLRVLGVVTQ